MEKALQDDILVAGGASVVDATKSARSTRRSRGITRDIPRIFREEFIVLSLSAGYEALAKWDLGGKAWMEKTSLISGGCHRNGSDSTYSRRTPYQFF
jgi:hypothetical protein